MNLENTKFISKRSKYFLLITFIRLELISTLCINELLSFINNYVVI
jgi:hypothetical protein